MRIPVTMLVAVGTAAAVLSACTTEGDVTPVPTSLGEDTTDAQGTTAVGGAVKAVEPGEELPPGMDVHDVQVFQVAIPSEWVPEGPTDEPTLAFWGEEVDGAPVEGAMLRWDPEGASAREAAEALEAELAAAGTAATLEELSWPDVEPGGAFLVSFDSEMAPGAVRHVRQIFADLPQGGTGTVIGFAEPDAFASSRVPEVLGSFRVAP